MRTRILASLALGALASQAALADIDWNITGAGARAEGMAGAFTGVADDATSIVWNPAGLATLVRPEASFVMRSIANKTEYDWSSDLNALGLEDGDESDSHALLNFLSVAYPFQLGGRNVVAAVALQSQLDGYGDTRENSGYTDSFGDPLVNSEKSEGSVSTITPGFGVQLTPLLSVGLAANVWMGSIDGDVVSFDDDGFNVYELDYSYTYKASGVNVGLGALLDFSTLASALPLKVGINLRSPFDLELDYSDDRDPVLFYPEGKITVQMPLMLSLGASWRLGEFTTLAVDVESRMYGGSKVKEHYEDPYGNSFDVPEAPLAEHEKDLFQIRLGAEHLFVTDFAVVPLRIGVRTVPTLDSDYEYDSATDTESYDSVTGFGFALGTGLIFEKMAFDLAFSNSNYENKITVDGDTWLATTSTTSKLTLSGIFYF